MRANNTSDGKYYREEKYRDKILTVSFKNKKEVPKNAIVSWDLSLAEDNSVIGYLKPSSKDGM